SALTAAETVRFGTLDPLPSDHLPAGYIAFGRHGVRTPVDPNYLIQSFQLPAFDKRYFCSRYLQFHTLTLSGRGRIDLVNEQAAGDLQRPTSSFQVLFTDDFKRKEVRRIIHEAFGSYLVADPTNLGNLRLRLSPREPVDDLE